MIRRFTVLILFLSLSSPSLAATAADGVCMMAKSSSPDASSSGSAHACCSTAETPETCATGHAMETCATGTLAMSCCSVDPAPYRQSGAGALLPAASIQPDQLVLSTPLRGLHVVEPAVHVSQISPEADTARSPPPLRALFCTYLI